jgi:hypothetical protein
MEALKALWHQIIIKPWTPTDTIVLIIATTLMAIACLVIYLIERPKTKR